MGLEVLPKTGGTINAVSDDIRNERTAHLLVIFSASCCSTNCLNKKERRSDHSEEGNDVHGRMVITLDAHLHLNYHIDSLSWIRRGLLKSRPDRPLLLFGHG